jgi:hypothetical protein
MGASSANHAPTRASRQVAGGFERCLAYQTLCPKTGVVLAICPGRVVGSFFERFVDSKGDRGFVSSVLMFGLGFPPRPCEFCLPTPDIWLLASDFCSSLVTCHCSLLLTPDFRIPPPFDSKGHRGFVSLAFAFVTGPSSPRTPAVHRVGGGRLAGSSLARWPITIKRQSAGRDKRTWPRGLLPTPGLPGRRLPGIGGWRIDRVGCDVFQGSGQFLRTIPGYFSRFGLSEMKRILRRARDDKQMGSG